MAATKRKHLLVAALLILVAISCVLIFRPSKPSTVYKGRTIDQWLEEATKVYATKIAFENLKEAGEIAVPDLVRAMTSRPSFFYRQVKPRLPIGLRNLVPQDSRGAQQYMAFRVISLMPLRAEQLIPAVRRSLPNCDEKGLQLVARAMLTAAQRNGSDLREVVKVIPDLRLACSRIGDTNGVSADYIQRLDGLVQASDQLRSWFLLDAPLEDVRQRLKAHNFSYVCTTNDSSVGGSPFLFFDCIPRHLQFPGGTNPIIGIHLLLRLTSNKVSSVSVAYPGLFQ